MVGPGLWDYVFGALAVLALVLSAISSALIRKKCKDEKKKQYLMSINSAFTAILFVAMASYVMFSHWPFKGDFIVDIVAAIAFVGLALFHHGKSRGASAH